MFRVGDSVRVLHYVNNSNSNGGLTVTVNKDGNVEQHVLFCRRGMVSVVHSKEQSIGGSSNSTAEVASVTYDIIYNKSSTYRMATKSGQDSTVAGSAENADEECDVAADRIRHLEDFEIPSTVAGAVTDSETDAEGPLAAVEKLKSYGNTLFGLKDYEAALTYYHKALAAMRLGEMSVGSSVLVTVPGRLDFAVGMISDVIPEEEAYDVIYEPSLEESSPRNSSTDDNEESGVKGDRLVLVSANYPGRALQRSITMNMAKACLKSHLPGWGIRHTTVAIGISQTLRLQPNLSDEDRDTINKQLADSLYFRGKTLLAVNRPQHALKDMARLQYYDSSKSELLSKEIKQFRNQKSKTDRKLAKDIASWLDVVLSNNGAGIDSTGNTDGKTDQKTVSTKKEQKETKPQLPSRGNAEGKKNESTHTSSTLTSDNKASFFQDIPSGLLLSMNAAIVIFAAIIIAYFLK